MNKWRITYTHNGLPNQVEIEAETAQAAKKILYSMLGVKRLIGTITERI
jgi:hypothetical protein